MKNLFWPFCSAYFLAHLPLCYESYAIVYDCRKSLVKGASAEFLFILTREKFPPQSLISSLYDSLESMGIETKPLKVTQQEGCPDFPPDCC